MRNNQQNFFMDAPSTDFEKVRDGRGSMPLWVDIDLTNARSIAGNSAFVLNIAGNSFYIDQDTANVGTATVHFQDTNLGASSAPLFVSAGFIANVPFTQLLIENTAQAGKRLRIFYGVDIDFQAGVNASISISGNVGLSGRNNAVYLAASENWGASFVNAAALAANTPDTVFTAGANANGAIVWDIGFTSCDGSGNGITTALAKNAAPASYGDGAVILNSSPSATFGANFKKWARSNGPIKIPAGLGLFFISSEAESSNNIRYCRYTLL